VIPWTAAHQASLSITNSGAYSNSCPSSRIGWSRPSNHLIFSCPLLLLPSIFPSIRVFSSESVLCIRWPEYWSFSFRISPSKEYSGLIFFRNDLVGFPYSPRDSQESSPTPQFESIYSSVLSFLYSPNLCEMLSQHPYVTTGKIIALSRWTFVSKVMSLLFNMLSRLVIAFLSRGKCLLISGLQPPSAVILEPKKIKSVTVSIVPIYLP